MTRFSLKSRDYLNSPDRKRTFNRTLFSAIAGEYGWMTRILSFSRDAAWKRGLVSQLPDLTAPYCADLACGNGDLIALALARYPGARIVGVDLCPPMLAIARRRFNGNPNVAFCEGDMTRTGLSGAAFDLVTVGYGLRNAPDLDASIAEIARLLKPGGTVALLDFCRWQHPFAFRLESALLRLWCGSWGIIRSGNPDTYAYIADSLARFPPRKTLHEKLTRHGLDIVNSRRHFGGVIEAIVARTSVMRVSRPARE